MRTGPQFYYITDRRKLSGISFDACICRALQWGVNYIQIREKDMTDKALFDTVRRVVIFARGTKCSILVNGRADIALAAGAHGVHLPSSGLNPADIRGWVPGDFLIGVSVHTENEIRSASDSDADYVLQGHLFPTASKSGLGEPVGLEYLKKVCSSTTIPILGLGGIKANRVASVLEAGADGIAGISLFQEEREFEALKRLYP